MALQETGPISLDDIQTEFGGNNPINVSEYYGAGGAPGSGTISLGDFYGLSASIPLAPLAVYAGKDNSGYFRIWSSPINSGVLTTRYSSTLPCSVTYTAWDGTYYYVGNTNYSILTAAGNQLWRSPDGITWTSMFSESNSSTGAMMGIAVDGNGGVAVSFSNATNIYVLKSTDSFTTHGVKTSVYTKGGGNMTSFGTYINSNTGHIIIGITLNTTSIPEVITVNFTTLVLQNQSAGVSSTSSYCTGYTEKYEIVGLYRLDPGLPYPIGIIPIPVGVPGTFAQAVAGGSLIIYSGYSNAQTGDTFLYSYAIGNNLTILKTINGVDYTSATATLTDTLGTSNRFSTWTYRGGYLAFAYTSAGAGIPSRILWSTNDGVSYTTTNTAFNGKVIGPMSVAF